MFNQSKEDFFLQIVGTKKSINIEIKDNFSHFKLSMIFNQDDKRYRRKLINLKIP